MPLSITAKLKDNEFHYFTHDSNHLRARSLLLSCPFGIWINWRANRPHLFNFYRPSGIRATTGSNARQPSLIIRPELAGAPRRRQSNWFKGWRQTWAAITGGTGGTCPLQYFLWGGDIISNVPPPNIWRHEEKLTYNQWNKPWKRPFERTHITGEGTKNVKFGLCLQNFRATRAVIFCIRFTHFLYVGARTMVTSSRGHLVKLPCKLGFQHIRWSFLTLRKSFGEACWLRHSPFERHVSLAEISWITTN